MKVKVMTLLFAVLVVCVCSHATLVAVLETTSDAKLTNWDENAYVTDKLREYAGRTLANKGITIMTRENAHAILEGKALEDCVGSCAVETGKNLRADFVVNAHVGKFGKMLTMTVELYEVETKKLFGSFTLKKKTADELMVALEQEAPALLWSLLGLRMVLKLPWKGNLVRRPVRWKRKEEATGWSFLPSATNRLPPRCRWNAMVLFC